MSEKFVYHVKQRIMLGSVLYPLNQLEKTYPGAYEKSLRKYQGREYLLDDKIKLLNCLWNDVIHCSPIDIRKVGLALTKIGFKLKPLQFYKIPIELLVGVPTAFYKYSPGVTGAGKGLSDDEISAFEIDKYVELEDLPEKTISYFEQIKKENGRPLLFCFVPHVLVKGTIDISNCEIVDWL